VYWLVCHHHIQPSVAWQHVVNARSRVNSASSKPLSSLKSPGKKEWNEALLSKAPTKIAPQLQLWSMGCIQDALANVRALQAAHAWPSSAPPTKTSAVAASPTAPAAGDSAGQEANVFTHVHSCLLGLDPAAPLPSLPSAELAAADRSAAVTPPLPFFRYGELVKVTGLTTDAGKRYNGTTGIVQERSKTDPDDRVRVLLPDKVHFIKAGNLVSVMPVNSSPLTQSSGLVYGNGNVSSSCSAWTNNPIGGSAATSSLQLELAHVIHDFLIAQNHTSPSSSLREPAQPYHFNHNNFYPCFNYDITACHYHARVETVFRY
jgi:hypothetical protein